MGACNLVIAIYTCTSLQQKGQIMEYGYPILIDSKLETQAYNRHLGLHDAVALQQPMKKS